MAEEQRRYISLTDNWTTHDVVVYYKNARNKIDEIEKLAELIASDEETIIQILVDAGAFKGTFRKCNHCDNMFPAIKKTTVLCPECRAIREKITRKKWKIKKNLVAIESYSRANAKLRQEIDEMEREYGFLGKSNNEI